MVGSGRTDAGAHSLGQVVAFSTGTSLSPDVLQRAINAHLPDDLAVTEASEVETDFHPRFDASSRLYRYTIWNRAVRSPFWAGRAAHVKRPLDAGMMSEAADLLVGRHDFGAFVPVGLPGSRERTIYHAACRREGDLVTVDLEATGFMRQMVRAIVGTLVRVGLRSIELNDFRRILLSADRTKAGTTMPAHGLYLVAVNYPASGQPQNIEYKIGSSL